MIRHDNLFNPIAQTRVMDTSEFTRYIRMGDLSEWFSVSDESTKKRVQEIKEDFYGTHPLVPKESLDELWRFVCPMVEKNPALAKFILDRGGAVSNYFFPWLKAVATSPSAALEMAYGAGYDVCGEWVTGIPEYDEIADFIHNVPTFVYQRERQLFMADLVSSVMDNGRLSRSAIHHPHPLVVDLGAGRMAWSRYHGFKFDSTYLKVLAIDKDPDIDPEDLFYQYASHRRNGETDTLASLGIEYRKADIMPWLATTDIRDADLIMLGGVASYVPLPVFTEVVLKPVHRILKERGAFFFDLQLDCPQYEWTIKLFSWPEMKLAKSAEEAISQVEGVRRQLWDAGMKYNAEYHVDTACANPSAVMIVFQKL